MVEIVRSHLWVGRDSTSTVTAPLGHPSDIFSTVFCRCERSKDHPVEETYLPDGKKKIPVKTGIFFDLKEIKRFLFLSV